MLLKNSKFILINFFNKSICLWFGYVVPNYPKNHHWAYIYSLLLFDAKFNNCNHANWRPEEKTKHVFQLCDRDKDGTVSYAEICYLFSFIQPEIPGKIMEARKKYCIYIRFIRTILYSTLKYVFSSERAWLPNRLTLQMQFNKINS